MSLSRVVYPDTRRDEEERTRLATYRKGKKGLCDFFHRPSKAETLLEDGKEEVYHSSFCTHTKSSLGYICVRF
jgi:hypothetical protein